jgi:homoserine O-succinyltransferase
MVIGLVNIMPPAAIERTERQFRTMLDRAAPWQNIRLRLFRPHSLVGAASGLANIHQPYETMDALWESRLDGLIVTGTQPSSSSITDEECWPVLKKLLVWAGDNTISAIWSCFAAHAAVYGLSGVQRQPLAEKLSGIFLAKRTEKHGILGSAPASWRVPHSRYHTLSESALRQNDYTILTNGPRIGPDIFVKRQGVSDFLFFQGHPEYGPDMLAAEYRRDIRRYVSGALAAFPNCPEDYFIAESTAVFTDLRARAGAMPKPAVLAALAAPPVTMLQHSWSATAERIYAGWLQHLATQKALRAGALVRAI